MLKLVNGTDEHLSADEIRARLRSSGIDLQRSSVFNVLAKLAQAGVVRRAELPGATRFEGHTGAHDHFVCRSCGRVDNVRSARPALPSVDGRIESTTVVHTGLCGDCSRR